MSKKLVAALGVVMLAACTRVPVGYVGIKVEKYGADAGVQSKVLPPGGPYFTGWNTDVYTFPTFTQNYTWTQATDEGREGKVADESINFQSKEGTNINGDFGITYHVDVNNVPVIFQKYRLGMREITDVYLRNMVRDALVEVAGSMTLDEISGDKAKFMTAVNDRLKTKALVAGISVEQLSPVGNFRYPQAIIDAMNAKMTATQKAIQIQNELAQTQAEAAKRVANSQADVTVAQNEAQATALRGAALAKNPEVLQQMWIEKWHGDMPQYLAGSNLMPMPVFNVGK